MSEYLVGRAKVYHNYSFNNKIKTLKDVFVDEKLQLKQCVRRQANASQSNFFHKNYFAPLTWHGFGFILQTSQQGQQYEKHYISLTYTLKL